MEQQTNHGMRKDVYGTNFELGIDTIKVRQNGTISLFYKFYAKCEF